MRALFYLILAGVALFFAFTSDAETPRNCIALANGNSSKLRECTEVNNLAIGRCRSAKDVAAHSADQKLMDVGERNKLEKTETDTKDAEAMQQLYSEQVSRETVLKADLKSLKKQMHRRCEEQQEQARSVDAVQTIDRLEALGDQYLDAKLDRVQRAIDKSNEIFNRVDQTAQTAPAEEPSY